MRNWMSIYKPIVSVAFLIFVALALSVSAQQSSSTSAVFHNERLKTLALKDSPVTGDNYERVVSGFWVSESKDPTKTLVFPMQVKITCTRSDKSCKELSVTLGPHSGNRESHGP
jgi:hypothetical protein